MLERDELHHQHAVVRGFRDREMELAPRARERADVVELALRLGEELRSRAWSSARRILGRELGGEAFDRALGVHDLAAARR